MKIFFSFMLCALAINCSAQEPQAAIELPEMNLLYRGYPNKINIAVTNNDGREIKLIGANYSARRIGDLDQFVIKPGEGKKTTLHVLLVQGKEIDTVRTIEYRVKKLPDPELYWSGYRNGGKGNIRNNLLFAKYPPEIPLNATFSIIGWTIFHEGDTISGERSNLKPAQDLFKTIKEKTTLFFEVECIGPDGIIRIKKGSWLVSPWEDEQNDEPKVFKCG